MRARRLQSVVGITGITYDTVQPEERPLCQEKEYQRFFGAYEETRFRPLSFAS